MDQNGDPVRDHAPPVFGREMNRRQTYEQANKIYDKAVKLEQEFGEYFTGKQPCGPAQSGGGWQPTPSGRLSARLRPCAQSFWVLSSLAAVGLPQGLGSFCLVPPRVRAPCVTLLPAFSPTPEI